MANDKVLDHALLSRPQDIDESPLERAEKARPRRSISRVPGAQQNLRRETMFQTTDKSKRHIIKVSFRPDGVDDKDDMLTRAAILALGDRYIKFDAGTYITRNADVVAWLRNRIRNGSITNVREYLPQPTAVISDDGYELAIIHPETGERMYGASDIEALIEARLAAMSPVFMFQPTAADQSRESMARDEEEAVARMESESPHFIPQPDVLPFPDEDEFNNDRFDEMVAEAKVEAHDERFAEPSDDRYDELLAGLELMEVDDTEGAVVEVPVPKATRPRSSTGRFEKVS